jgi:N-acetyl-alpha-D-muramate 1-phosphate uridylyltransferase
VKQIVILAGGQATRLYPITKKIPKSMVLINKKPFLEYQLGLCKKNRITDVVLCVGHLWEKIFEYFGDGKKFGVNIKYSVEKERLDTGGALKNAFPYLDDEFFVMYGDSYLTIDWQEVFSHYKKMKAEGLMVVYENNWSIEPSQVLLNEGGSKVIEYDKEKPRPEMKFMEYGLNIFRKKLMTEVPEKIFPISRYFDILIKRDQLSAYISKERFYEIGSHGGLENLKNIL